MWGAGLAGVGVAVGRWTITGRGFGWLTAGGVLVLAGIVTAGGGGWLAVVAMAAAGIAVLFAGKAWAPLWLLVAGLACLAVAADRAGDLSAITGALAIGGVTGELFLGHWFLVDPRLPRWALKRLGWAGIVGLVSDTAILVAKGALSGRSEPWVEVAFLVLAATSLLLMVGVWFALDQPRYSGVMAATGLSYLALLTTVGSMVAGRWLVVEGESALLSTLGGL